MVAPMEVAPRTGFFAQQLSLHTARAHEFVDLTDEVQQAIDRSGVVTGFAVVTSQHTTASIVVNEHEPELLKDLDAFLDSIAPSNRDYAHNRVPCNPGEQPNGHAHCQALLLSASATIPIVNGRMGTGTYQRVFLVELDHARPRRVTISVLGA
jgi:secondary thiamine-phosphate synthase enzyme